MHFSLVGVIAGLAALLGAGFAWWLWWRLPKRQADRLRLTIRDPKARADVEDNFRKTIGQLLGGAAVLLGVGFAYIQFSQQQQTSQQQLQASRDLLISNQVSKGFEQLGNENSVVVRLGGIYALEGVMNTSKEYHKPVLEALSAFVRYGTRDATGDGRPAPDIQAALTVIGRRAKIDTGKPDPPLPLIGHMPKANLLGVDLTSADLRFAKINTGKPDLTGAHIPKADLQGADLSGADLRSADLRFADLRFADLSDANLRGANLIGADLSDAALGDADLRGAYLGRANLGGTNLGGADLGDADLGDAYLIIADLRGTYLGGANLSGANLSGANLSGANLIGTKVFQEQLDKACGIEVKLDSGLTLKPCDR